MGVDTYHEFIFELIVFHDRFFNRSPRIVADDCLVRDHHWGLLDIFILAFRRNVNLDLVGVDLFGLFFGLLGLHVFC